MKDPCLTPEEIVNALHAEPGDKRRDHLDTCAWCQSLRSSYELFGDTGNLPAGADPADAEARLGDFLEREIAGSPAEPLPRQVLDGPGPHRAWWRQRTAGVLAAAAVLVVAVGLQLATNIGTDDSRQIRLRGGDEPRLSPPQLMAPEFRQDGGIDLAWTPLTAATAYEIHLVDGAQATVAVLPAGQATKRTVTADDLAVLRDRPQPHSVRIIALREGDVIARSLPRVLSDGN